MDGEPHVLYNRITAAPVGLKEDINMSLVLPDNVTIPGYSQRLEYLTGAKIIPPMDVLVYAHYDDRERKWTSKNTHIQIARHAYIESVKAYLLGLPNSSVYSIIKFLQLSLKKELSEHAIDTTTGREADPEIEYIDPDTKRPVKIKVSKADIFKLIEAASLRFNIDKNNAQYFRGLRNTIHEEKSLENQDALEAIRHVSKFCHSIVTFEELLVLIKCTRCREEHTGYKLPKADCYLGHSISYKCSKWKGKSAILRFNI